jgi:hypothetical protein
MGRAPQGKGCVRGLRAGTAGLAAQGLEAPAIAGMDGLYKINSALQQSPTTPPSAAASVLPVHRWSTAAVPVPWQLEAGVVHVQQAAQQVLPGSSSSSTIRLLGSKDVQDVCAGRWILYLEGCWQHVFRHYCQPRAVQPARVTAALPMPAWLAGRVVPGPI